MRRNNAKQASFMKMTIADDTEAIVGRPIWRQIYDYLEPARTALCRRTMLP
jgi:hypothetical protein